MDITAFNPAREVSLLDRQVTSRRRTWSRLWDALDVRSTWQRAWTTRSWLGRPLGFRTYDVGVLFAVAIYFVTLWRAHPGAREITCVHFLMFFYWWRRADVAIISAHIAGRHHLRRSRWAVLLEMGTVLSTLLILSSFHPHGFGIVALVGWSFVVAIYLRTRHRCIEGLPNLRLRWFQKSANIASLATLLWLIIAETASTEWHFIFHYLRFIEAVVR